MNDLEFYEANFYADIMPVTETQLLALGDRPILFRKKFMAKARLVVQRSAYSYQSWLTEQMKQLGVLECRIYISGAQPAEASRRARM